MMNRTRRSAGLPAVHSPYLVDQRVQDGWLATQLLRARGVQISALYLTGSPYVMVRQWVEFSVLWFIRKRVCLRASRKGVRLPTMKKASRTRCRLLLWPLRPLPSGPIRRTISPSYNAAAPTRPLPAILSGTQLTGAYFSHPYQVAIYKNGGEDPCRAASAALLLPLRSRNGPQLPAFLLSKSTHGAACSTCMKEAMFAYQQTKAGANPGADPRGD